MKKPFDMESKSLPVELMKVARTAVESESPLEAEKYLNSYRLETLELLRPMNTFSEDMVFYYGLKLKLISRPSAVFTMPVVLKVVCSLSSK